MLVSQVQNYFDVDGARRWFSSTAWIRFDWQSDNQYGVIAPPNWEWQLHHHDSQVDVTAPPLVFFGPKIVAQTATVLDHAMGVSETLMIQNKMTEMLEITEAQGSEMLQSSELRALARLSLESQLLNIFQQANPALGLLKVNVTFTPS